MWDKKNLQNIVVFNVKCEKIHFIRVHHLFIYLLIYNLLLYINFQLSFCNKSCTSWGFATTTTYLYSISGYISDILGGLDYTLILLTEHPDITC